MCVITQPDLYLVRSALCRLLHVTTAITLDQPRGAPGVTATATTATIHLDLVGGHEPINLFVKYNGK
jgi:hypothetical protein